MTDRTEFSKIIYSLKVFSFIPDFLNEVKRRIRCVRFSKSLSFKGLWNGFTAGSVKHQSI